MPVWHIAEAILPLTDTDTQYHSGHQNNRGITFLTADNKNGILASINNDGVRSRIIHTKLEIKIVSHDALLPKDISHYPTGQ